MQKGIKYCGACDGAIENGEEKVKCPSPDICSRFMHSRCATLEIAESQGRRHHALCKVCDTYWIKEDVGFHIGRDAGERTRTKQKVRTCHFRCARARRERDRRREGEGPRRRETCTKERESDSQRGRP